MKGTIRMLAYAIINRSSTLPAAVKTGETALDRSRALERFLASVERRAFTMAQIALRHTDDALDVVQDAMLQLARRYSGQPAEEWPPLFYRILQNRIRDCQRRRLVRSRVMAWLPLRAHDEEDAPPDPVDMAVSETPAPAHQVQLDETVQALALAVGELPARQQQAFLLRNFEGLDVAATAAAMGCSEGSVKTHYFRAVQTLKERLGEFWS